MTSPRFRDGWVFSPREDLWWFGGPVVLSAAVAALAAQGGVLDAPVSPWVFLLVIVGCDVAHVWATLYRSYLDPEVRRARAGLLTIVPLACFALGVCLYAQGPMVFWRALAYVAAFHFVRQPWGWMSYAARRAGETSRWDRRLDFAAIHAATLYPVVWWHAHLPRSFQWFVAGDFAGGLPPVVATVAGLVHGTILVSWLARQGWLAATGRPVNRAKALVLASTWAIWVGGIVLLDSDLVFTVSNVVAHGVPYFALVHRYGAARWRGASGALGRVFARPGLAAYVGSLVLLAYVEESVWDGAVWHQHAGWFAFPRVSLPEAALSLAVPLLAVPQATHYVLDAFLWRPSADPALAATLSLRAGVASPVATPSSPVTSSEACPRAAAPDPAGTAAPAGPAASPSSPRPA